MYDDIDHLAERLKSLLHDRFHFPAFRAGQLEAITALFQEKRLLCIQPTGYGKSLLYQLPAVLIDGITVVISPLLALMRDQVQQLNQRFSIPSASINSDQSDEENAKARRLAEVGQIKVLFVAPEKLDRVDYFDFLLSLPVGLIVIDEAHCISTWGHDFRPSYRQIIHFVQAAERCCDALMVLGITATANHKTEKDIKRQLVRLKGHIAVQRQNMDRPNIQLSVIRVSGVGDKLALLLQLIKQLEGHGLIYCATRDNTELVAEYLQAKNVQVAAYHAGYSPDKKRRLQQHFIENQFKAIAATNALGMGIDKQDLRFIVHFDMPGSITAYYQEVGRCGRDGRQAHGILLFDERDKKVQEYFINSAQPSVSDFECVMDCVKGEDAAPALSLLKNKTGLHPTRMNIVLAELIEQGFLQKKSERRKQVYEFIGRSNPPDLSRYANQLKVRLRELEDMVAYGYLSSDCLMARLRKALGDDEARACGHCSSCQALTFSLKGSATDQAYIRQWLIHRAMPIDLGKTSQSAEGVAVLDGKVRSKLFVAFMKTRAQKEEKITRELLELIQHNVKKLAARYAFTSVVVVPSRTWCGRDQVAQFIADYLKVPVFTDYLHWETVPEMRQGELLNNDQRRNNVDKKMQSVSSVHLPKGAVLLFDDYVGSGATLKEAARVLRRRMKVDADIVPLAVASIRWRLGKRGMI